MKNRWKTAFWICFLLLISIGLFGLYTIVDQGTTITYMKQGYSDTETDMDTLIKIMETNNLTKKEVEKTFADYRLKNELIDFKSDTIRLKRVTLIFEKDTLKKIEKQW